MYTIDITDFRQMNNWASYVCIACIMLFAHPLLAREPVVVQSAQCQDWANYSSTYQCSFRNSTSPSNAIIVFALVSGTPTIAVTTVRDDHQPSSNSYVQDLRYVFGDVQAIHFYSSAATAKTQTITLSANGSTHFQVVLLEVAGLASQQPLLDRSSLRDNGYNSGMTFTSGATDKTRQAAELLVGWAEQAYPNVMTFTDTPPWMLVQQEPIGGSRIVYRVTKSVGTYEYTGTFTGSGDYRVGAAIVAYKAADE